MKYLTLFYYSTGGSDSEDKTLASKQKEQQQDKKKLPPDYAASSAPHLRTIIEQQSVEEREAESLRDQPPSPIQDFIDKAQSGRARGVTWPLLTMGYQNGLYPKGEELINIPSLLFPENNWNFELVELNSVYVSSIPYSYTIS